MPTFRPARFSRNFVRDVFLASTWLLFLTLINQNTEFPVYSIFPYLLPVVRLAWRYGVLWGFVFAALATLAAIPVGYAEAHSATLHWAGFTTYAKLSCAAAGISVGKWIVDDRTKG